MVITTGSMSNTFIIILSLCISIFSMQTLGLAAILILIQQPLSFYEFSYHE